MESLFALGVLAFLSGPILGIVALVQISGLHTKIRALKKELERFSPAAQFESAPPQPEPPRPIAIPEPAEMPLAAEPPQQTKSTAWGNVASQPEVPAPKTATPPAPRDMENTIASRWFVWVGGAAVALGGLLFVKYAHDNGLIPPVLRVMIGLIFAAGLVAAGEWTRKHSAGLASGYIPAALSAAGIVIAFGVIYAAYALYDLLSPAVCFPLLVAVGVGALWLSRRQGPFIAALGLLGSYAAPALVPSDHPSAYGFFAYLLVIVAASLYELRNRPWWWLGFAALAGATLWSLMWIHGGLFQSDHVLPTGIFALLMGTAATLIPTGRGILAAEMGTLAQPEKLALPMQIAISGCVAAGIILAGLVWQSGHGTLALVFFALGMAAITGFGWLRDGMVGAPIAAALASLIVLMVWPDVGFHDWAMDERGLWSTVPGIIEPPRFRNAMFFALGAFLLIGVSGTFKRRERLPWASLAAGSAFLFLFGAWARADFTQSNGQWALVAIALAAVLGFAADRIWREADRAGTVLVGGAALLALFAIDRVLDGVWQTMATALLATALVFSLRRVALSNVAVIAAAIASLAAIRLFWGREFWGEPMGLPLGAHWVLYGYGVPAILFWLSSRQFPGETLNRFRTAFEGLALGLGISLVSLELRVLIGGGITADRMSLLEMSAHALAWLGAAYGLAYRQQIFSTFISMWGARVLLGASCAVLFIGLTARNPVVTGDALDGGMVFNSLWLAYLAPVPLLALMARKLEGLGMSKFRNAFGVFALLLVIAFVTLQVKRFFQDETLSAFFQSDAESYCISAAWIVTAIAIFVGGIGLQRQNIRLAGLAILVLAILKVFAFDLFELGGLWRIASIVGLGLCLIGVGWLYTRYVQQAKTSEPA